MAEETPIDPHKLALKRFKAAMDAVSEMRNTSSEERRFEHGGEGQWPDYVLAFRQQDKQSLRPCVTVNRIPAFKRQVINELMQIKPQIKVRPVDSESDPKAANIYDGMIRVIERNCNAVAAYHWGADNCVSVGWGYWRIVPEYTGEGQEQEIKIKRILNQWSVFLDPNREEPDGSDAKWGFIVRQIPKDEFEARYPDKPSGIDTDGDAELSGQWYTDNTVSIAEYYYLQEDIIAYDALSKNMAQARMNPAQFMMAQQNGQVLQAKPVVETRLYHVVMSGSEFLEPPRRQPGKYIPIVEMQGVVEIVDGEIYYSGIVRDLMDPQRLYNYGRSAHAERTAMEPKAPFVGYEGQFKSSKWKKANQYNYAYLEASFPEGTDPRNPLPLPQRQPGPQGSPGWAAEIGMAAQEMKDITGIHGPGLGEVTPDTSGAAINARRSESDVSQSHYAHAFAQSMVHTGRILISMIPEVYPGLRAVEIVNGRGESEVANIGRGVIRGEQAVDISTGKFDVIIDLGPSYATKRQESRQFLLELARHSPEFMRLSGDALVKLGDVENYEELAKRFRTLLPPEVLAAENPEIASLQMRHRQQMQQVLQLNQQLRQHVEILNKELQNKQGELKVKRDDLKRKAADDIMGHLEKMTELELEHDENIPGSAV